MDDIPSTSAAKLHVPPLPPRNTGDKNGVARSDSISEKIPSEIALDRRKTTNKLYEIVTDQRTQDLELMEFYFMVKELRSQYHYNDETTNMGHIIASEFNYHYSDAQSLKVIVHPMLTAFQEDCETPVVKSGQIKGYGTPIVFTCDSMSI